jgi:hypothetical protein
MSRAYTCLLIAMSFIYSQYKFGIIRAKKCGAYRSGMWTMNF